MSKRGDRELYIADIAETMSAKYFSSEQLINPIHIIEKENIILSHEAFDDDFLGMINCYPDENPFHIFINKNKHPVLDHSRCRSTLGHELGHYSIPEHRKKLESGEHLSFDGTCNYSANRMIEFEAQIFSANVLMPKTRFLFSANNSVPGMTAILLLSKKFGTSVSSTAFHYSKCNAVPCITIKWDNDNKIEGRWVSKYFLNLSKNCLQLKYNTARLNTDCEIISLNNSEMRFNRSYTYLSSWFFNLNDAEVKDMLLVEESCRLGNYGGITILYPAS